MVLKFEYGETNYYVNVEEERITIEDLMLGRGYGNSISTSYETFGKKSVVIRYTNNGWACRGHGMTDSWGEKIINQELHDLILKTIERIQETQNRNLDETEKWEESVSILRDFRERAEDLLYGDGYE